MLHILYKLTSNFENYKNILHLMRHLSFVIHIHSNSTVQCVSVPGGQQIKVKYRKVHTTYTVQRQI